MLHGARRRGVGRAAPICGDQAVSPRRGERRTAPGPVARTPSCRASMLSQPCAGCYERAGLSGRARDRGRDRPRRAPRSSGLSTTSVSVVSSMPAIDAALTSAERVTLTGSRTPWATRSPYSPGGGVVALADAELADLGDHDVAVDRRRSRRSSAAARRADLRTIADAGRLVAGRGRGRPSSTAAACTSAEPPPAMMPSSIAARVAETASSMRCFFSLSSTSVAAPTLIDADAAGQLGEPLLELLAVPVGVGVLDLGLDLVDAARDLGAASPAPSTIVVSSLVIDDAPGLAQHLETDLVELEPDLGGDDLATGEDRDVLQHRLAAVAEGRGLDGGRVERAADLVHDQRGQRLALDVLGQDEQRLAGLR